MRDRLGQSRPAPARPSVQSAGLSRRVRPITARFLPNILVSVPSGTSWGEESREAGLAKRPCYKKTPGQQLDTELPDVSICGKNGVLSGNGVGGTGCGRGTCAEAGAAWRAEQGGVPPGDGPAPGTILVLLQG